MRQGTPASVVVTQTLCCPVTHGLFLDHGSNPCALRRQAGFSWPPGKSSALPPHLLRRSAWVCGLGAIPRRLLCCVLVAILSRPLLEGTGSLPAFYSLKTHTGDTSQFPCPHACLLPLPLALTVLSQPETKLRGASGVFFFLWDIRCGYWIPSQT